MRHYIYVQIKFFFLITNDTIYEYVSISKTARTGFAGGSVLSVYVNIDTTGSNELRVTENIN